LALFTYEKLAMLLVTNPVIASNCGLLVVDEIQMLSDRHRGAELELLLAKFLTLSAQAQIVALSATIDSLNGLDEWLRARPLLVQQRPIELREGIYTQDGVFRFRQWNTKQSGTENLPKSASDNVEVMLDTLVTHLVGAGEQILVFRKDKPGTVNTAQRIARLVNQGPVTDAISGLSALESTTVRDQLIECLRNGVAFHNADLVSEERQIIERHFREGQIRVICSTSTLAMGINLPARTVIIADTDRWDRNETTGQWNSVAMAVSEYRNMSGRAGRYRFQDEFGRSILLAKSQFDYDRYRVNYVGGTVEGITSRLGGRPIAQQVLDIVASGLGKNQTEITAFMMRTFAGFRTWTTKQAQEAISGMIQDSIQRCLDLKLVQGDAVNELAHTDLGRACASKKISLQTYILLRDWLSSSLPITTFAALYFATHAPELSRVTFSMSTSEYHSNGYVKYISENHEELGLPAEILERIRPFSQAQLGYEETKRLKIALLAREWTDGRQYRELEKVFQVRAGPIKNVCAYLAWIIDSAAAIAPLLRRTQAEADSLGTLAERLRYGVPADILSVAGLRAPGINRTETMRLLEHGYDSLDKILDADLADFQGVISRKVAAGLQKHIQASMKDTLERRKRDQVLRLQRLGVDTAALVALYEHTGTDLEITLCDLFTPPLCSRFFERVSKQREGEPDNLLHLPDGRVIAFSVTAAERKNISMKKAGEIIASAARYSPIAHVVVGRPDFHELAIKNADAIAASGINYKLIPISLLAEMYVRVHEGRLSEADVLAILQEEQGYLTHRNLEQYEVKRLSGEKHPTEGTGNS
jgi:replicative superfamily II helicase